MRVGAAYTQTGVLAKGRAEGSAGEIEEWGRELGLAGASPSPKAGTRREAGMTARMRKGKGGGKNVFLISGAHGCVR